MRTAQQRFLLFVALLVAAVIGCPAQSIFFSTLANFDGTNGSSPDFMSLVRGADGNFYGTTQQGGLYDHGTVFKITPGGVLTSLYSFCPQGYPCVDGDYPYGGLVQGSDGNLYGTTGWGGAYGDNSCPFWGACGTVFKITPAGSLNTLYSFCPEGGFCPNGNAPFGTLAVGVDSNFYGTTANGGAYSAGTVFRITPTGAMSMLQSFDDSDGASPYAGLVRASDGNFYGTTLWGGHADPSSPCPPESCGMVFKVTPLGTMTGLYNFCSLPNCADGGLPYAGLVQASDGNLYGTTTIGGTGNPACDNFTHTCGTLFKITPQGVFSVLYNFCSQGRCADGARPNGVLVQGRDGNLYGTTSSGGAYGWPFGNGTVFKISPNGNLTVLHSFNGADGTAPVGGLVQAPDGFFYGTTAAGGSYGYGTIFRIGVVRTCAACRP